jgi:hypothetical protein
VSGDARVVADCRLIHQTNRYKFTLAISCSNAQTTELTYKNNIIKRRDGSDCPGAFLEYIYHTKRKKMLRATQCEGETISSLSLSQPAALQHRDPSPARYRNSNNSIAPSYTPKSSVLKRCHVNPSTADPTCQNVLAHASRSKRAVRACLINS